MANFGVRDITLIPWVKNSKVIKTYIADQLKRDKESDQLSLFDPRDPFMGSK